MRDKQPPHQLVRCRHDGVGAELLAVRHRPVLVIIPKPFVEKKCYVNAHQSSHDWLSISLVSCSRSRRSSFARLDGTHATAVPA